MRPEDFALVQKVAREEAGLWMEPGRAFLAELRLGELARREGAATTSDWLDRVRAGTDASARRRLVEALLVHETRFFRDEGAFDLLRRDVLPELFAAPRAIPVTVWSAGCATGQEAYSLAMTLIEAAPAGAAFRVIATDWSESALSRAREGSYRDFETDRGLSAERRGRFFEAAGPGAWRARPALRNAVEFRAINLARAFPALPPVDVVFLRNVLIYFDSETKKEVLRRVREALRPGGRLFLGGTETALAMDPSFRLVEKHGAWCYQIPGAVPLTGGPR